MLLAAIVGAGIGFIGGAFRLSLTVLSNQRTVGILWLHHHGFASSGWIAPIVISGLAAAVAVYLTFKLAPQGSGSGIQRIESVLKTHLKAAPPWLLPVKFIGGALGIGGGLALGREGPIVQMGGTIGRTISDLFKRFVREPWTLIAAGSGAGLAVAFNAPLASTVFVLEELMHRFSARVFCATLIACITGALVLRWMLGSHAQFLSLHLAGPADITLPNFLLLGILAGLFGVGFNVSLIAVIRASDRLTRWPVGAKGAIAGAVTGFIAWFLPHVVGDGDDFAKHMVVNHIAWELACGYLALRVFLTIFSYGSGAPGGLFAPLLVFGALLGNGFSALESVLFHLPNHPAVYAVVAMAACFTSIIRSPLTGVLLLMEMTQSWGLILPMMAAAIPAYAIPELLGNPPIYETLRERDEASEQRAQPETKR